MSRLCFFSGYLLAQLPVQESTPSHCKSPVYPILQTHAEGAPVLLLGHGAINEQSGPYVPVAHMTDWPQPPTHVSVGKYENKGTDFPYIYIYHKHKPYYIYIYTSLYNSSKRYQA